jgi:chemotaxis protein MotB
MSTRVARQRRRRKRRGGDGDGHEDNERWLLTYADMITLLMALFMVLFSISSVNVSKFETLKEVLQNAFSPKVLSGGGSILPDGGAQATPSSQPPSNALVADPVAADPAAALREEDEFARLKHELDAYARRNGFADRVETLIRRRGLVIRLLTDEVLFDSGSAALRAGSVPLLAQISRLVELDRDHPVAVEGHTDTVPIATGVFPSNWELSGARAASVVRFMIGEGVAPARLEATGLAGLRPIADNETAAGRSRNRRVEIVLLRTGLGPEGGSRER